MGDVKITFGDPSTQVNGELCFPIDISTKQMTSYNYRRTEAEAHLRTYLKALKKHLEPKLPEGYDLKWWPEGWPPRGMFSFDPHSLTERYAIQKVVEGTPDSPDSEEYRKDWKAVQARWDADAAKMKQIVEEAHAAAIAEIGQPELHGPNGKARHTQPSKEVDQPLIIEFTKLIHERRRAGPDERSKCDQQIQWFMDDHADDPAFVRRAKTLLKVDDVLGREGGDRGIG